MGPTGDGVSHTKHTTLFQKMKNQLSMYVITITLSKVANPFLLDNRKRANVRLFEIKGQRSV